MNGEATGREKRTGKRQTLRGWRCRCDGLCLSQSHIKLTAATDGLQALFYTLVSITQLINRRPVTVGSKVSHTHKHAHCTCMSAALQRCVPLSPYISNLDSSTRSLFFVLLSVLPPLLPRQQSSQFMKPSL